MAPFAQLNSGLPRLTGVNRPARLVRFVPISEVIRTGLAIGFNFP